MFECYSFLSVVKVFNFCYIVLWLIIVSSINFKLLLVLISCRNIKDIRELLSIWFYSTQSYCKYLFVSLFIPVNSLLCSSICLIYLYGLICYNSYFKTIGLLDVRLMLTRTMIGQLMSSK